MVTKNYIKNSKDFDTKYSNWELLSEAEKEIIFDSIYPQAKKLFDNVLSTYIFNGENTKLKTKYSKCVTEFNQSHSKQKGIQIIFDLAIIYLLLRVEETDEDYIDDKKLSEWFTETNINL